MSGHTIKDELEERGHALIQATGSSMEPLLHPRKSSTLLHRPRGRLQKNDVVLFERADGRYVLHRIIKVTPDGYLIRGDNCLENEFVPEKQVIGVMAGFFPDESERFVTCEDSAYRGYVRTLPCRYALRRLKRGCSAAKRRLAQMVGEKRR